MSFRRYVLNRLGEWLLLSGAAAALSYLALSAFNVFNGIAHPEVLAMASAFCITGALLATSYSFRSRCVGYPAVAVVLLCIVGVAVASSQGENVLADEGGNMVLALVVVWPTCVASFVLTRRRVGCVAYLLAGALLCCFIEVLYQEHRYGAYLAFCLFAIGLVLYSGLARSKDAARERRSPAPAAAVAAGLAALSLGVSALVFFTVIDPLDPPKIRPVLTTEHVAVEEKYVRGVGDAVLTINPDLYTNLLLDSTVESSLVQEMIDALLESMQSVSEGDEEESPYAGASANLDDEGEEDLGAVTANPPGFPMWAVVAAAVVLAVVAVIGGRRIMRARWLARTLSLPASEVAPRIYVRVRDNLKALGIDAPEATTPSEFAERRDEVSAAFKTAEGTLDFVGLTRLFVSSFYGRLAPEKPEIDKLAAFQREFYRNARAYLGSFAYLRRWLFIK